jgi:hypothetical protein
VDTRGAGERGSSRQRQGHCRSHLFNWFQLTSCEYSLSRAGAIVPVGMRPWPFRSRSSVFAGNRFRSYARSHGRCPRWLCLEAKKARCRTTVPVHERNGTHGRNHSQSHHNDAHQTFGKSVHIPALRLSYLVLVPYPPVRSPVSTPIRRAHSDARLLAVWSARAEPGAIKRTLRLGGRGDPVENPTEPSVPEGTGQAGSVKMTPY